MRSARDERAAELKKNGVPADFAQRLAQLPALTAAPDIVLVAERAGQNIAHVAATYFAAEAYFRLDRIVRAARDIRAADYFDRLVLDRALDSIGDAERRLTAAMASGESAGSAAVEAWVKTREADVQRIRAAVDEIANSGLTLSKLSVAAGLLGDLVRALHLVQALQRLIRAGVARVGAGAVKMVRRKIRLLIALRRFAVKVPRHDTQPSGHREVERPGQREVERRARQGGAEFGLLVQELAVSFVHDAVRRLECSYSKRSFAAIVPLELNRRG
jgi:hypothetical protein